MPSVAVLDNYDSFTWNLVQYLRELGAEAIVLHNDQTDVPAIRALRPDGLLLSPGPCTPDEAGITLGATRALSGELPILGVCLGHQAIAQAFGARLRPARELVHGATSPVTHDGRTLFDRLPSPFSATRYHSWVVDDQALPDCLEVSASTNDDAREIMALRHKTLDVEGVQFHPESILTEVGKALLANWLRRLS